MSLEGVVESSRWGGCTHRRDILIQCFIHTAQLCGVCQCVCEGGGCMCVCVCVYQCVYQCVYVGGGGVSVWVRRGVAKGFTKQPFTFVSSCSISNAIVSKTCPELPTMELSELKNTVCQHLTHEYCQQGHCISFL